MNAQMATEKDYSYILTALKGFSSAIGDKNIDTTIEKIASLKKKGKGCNFRFFCIERNR